MLCLSLSAEACDDISGQGNLHGSAVELHTRSSNVCSQPQPVEQEGVAHLWNVGPDTLNERIVGLSSVSPAHGFEDSCAARLCRHVQDLTDIAMHCNDLR